MDQINKIEALQNLLINYPDSVSFEELKNSLMTSVFLLDQDFIKRILLPEFSNLIEIRPFQRLAIAKLFKEIFQNAIYSNKIKEELIKIISMSCELLLFSRNLFDENFLSFNQILQIWKPKKLDYFLQIFSLFGEYIQNYHHDMFKELTKVLKVLFNDSEHPPDQEMINLQQLLKNCVKKNDWNVTHEIIEFGMAKDTVTYLLKYDLLDQFQTLISQENLDINGRIENNLFEIHFIINSEKYLHVAAFYGSIKCFKYMVLNGAITRDSAQFCVAGGNLEAVRISERLGSSFHDCELQAIIYRRIEILSWLLQTRGSEHLDYFLLSSICNNFLSGVRMYLNQGASLKYKDNFNRNYRNFKKQIYSEIYLYLNQLQ